MCPLLFFSHCGLPKKKNSDSDGAKITVGPSKINVALQPISV